MWYHREDREAEEEYHLVSDSLQGYNRASRDKGSIACDGISFTVQKICGPVFQIAVIPHTLKVTTLGSKRVGSEINLEVDIVARYLQRCFSKERSRRTFSSRTILRELLHRGVEWKKNSN